MPKQTEEVTIVKRKIREELSRNEVQLLFFESGLTDQQTDVMTRYYLRGQSRYEIAKALYCSEVTISRIATRACKKICKHLIQKCDKN